MLKQSKITQNKPAENSGLTLLQYLKTWSHWQQSKFCRFLGINTRLIFTPIQLIIWSYVSYLCFSLKPSSSSSWKDPKLKKKFFTFFFLFIISENVIWLHIKVPALRLSHCLSIPKKISCPQLKILLNIMKQKSIHLWSTEIFFRKNHHTSGCYAIQYFQLLLWKFFFYNHRRICVRRIPWRPSSPKANWTPDVVWQMSRKETDTLSSPAHALTSVAQTQPSLPHRHGADSGSFAAYEDLRPFSAKLWPNLLVPVCTAQLGCCAPAPEFCIHLWWTSRGPCQPIPPAGQGP